MNQNFLLRLVYLSWILIVDIDIAWADNHGRPSGVSATVARKIGIKQSLVHGPGLKPHVIVLPARYFYVELKDEDGNAFTPNHVEDGAFKVKITCKGELPVWTQVLDRHDGSYIVRYKVFDSCMEGFRISVMYNSRHLAESPYVIKEPVHSDLCDCPQVTSEDWMKQVGCKVGKKQIADDLKLFPRVDFESTLNVTIERFHRPHAHSFCHYAIVQNQIYRKCYGQHVGFNMFSDNILTSLARKAILPDFQFIINLGDWPLVDKREEPLVPIFSWCKTDNHADIILPTYDLTEASLEAMGRVSLDMMTVQSNTEVLWDDKIPKLFWRGRDSRQERLDLIMLAKKYPDLMNASLTNFFFFRDKVESHGPKAPHVSFFKFFNYKYQLNIDGTVAAYRFPFLLAGDAVVLKTESPYYEHFYKDLKPSQHFVPVKANFEDLPEKIKWLQQNDQEAKRVGSQGTEYARTNLMPLDILCYHMEAFTEWAQRLEKPVQIIEDMEHVPQTKEAKARPSTCQCTSKVSKAVPKTEL